MRAWIEETSTIREWHSARESGIRNGIALWQAWLEPHPSRVTTNLQLAQAVATTDADHGAAQLIANDYKKTKQLNDPYVAQAGSSSYIAPDSLVNEALDRSIVTGVNRSKQWLQTGNLRTMERDRACGHSVTDHSFATLFRGTIDCEIT